MTHTLETDTEEYRLLPWIKALCDMGEYDLASKLIVAVIEAELLAKSDRDE